MRRARRAADDTAQSRGVGWRPELVKVERNRLNLDGVEQHDKHFKGPCAALSTRKGRCRGLVQSDDQNPGGPDFGAASGYRRGQPADHARPFVDGTAHSERWHCRTSIGGRRRRTCDNPRRDATTSRPAAQRMRLELAAAAGPPVDRRDHHGHQPGHRDGRRVRLHRAPARRPGHRRLGHRQAADRPRRIAAGAARSVRQGARQRPRHQPGPRGHVSGAGEVLHRPDRPRARRQARPGHRARQRDSSRRAGAVPSHQEQPGADRRARRRQDRDRRGPGPAHRRRRRAGEPARQDRRLAGPRFDGRGCEVPRRVRGAAQGRARRHQELGRARSSRSSTSCTPSSAQARPASLRWTQAT